MKNKKGLSAIVSSLLMVLLVIVIVGVVWGIVNNIIKDQTDTSCFGNYGKIKFNNDYTCYNSLTNELQFSIDVGDIEVEKLIIDLVDIDGSESIEIPTSNNPKIKRYNGVYGETILLPAKNGGKTYVIKDYGEIDSIRVSPFINGQRCEVSDSVNEFYDCALMVN